MSLVRNLAHRYGPRVRRTSVVTLQIFCLVHLVNEHLFEVRACTGASMLPTLSPSGDFVMHVRLPLINMLTSLRNRFDGQNTPSQKKIGGGSFFKMDQSQGTGLSVGDLVVAISPLDPSRTVCKRVIGLPGDTVAIDPRMRAIPDEAWRGRGKVEHDGLGQTIPIPKMLDGINLVDSMDSSDGKETREHDRASGEALQRHTYTRTKGDVQYVTIPSGHVWLAGDNMGNSTDSRHYGPIPMAMVRGKVIARVFPNACWLLNNLKTVQSH